jgi:hypothetical protein
VARLTDASGVRVKLVKAGEVEERNERLVADFLEGESERVLLVGNPLKVVDD